MSSGLQIERGQVDLLVREPAGEPEGALILNHGRATDEHDLQGLLEELDPDRRLLGVTTGAPLRGLPPGGRHWYVVERVGFPHPGTFGGSLSQLGEALDGLLAERGLEWSASVVGGFSQGAVMSFALALDADRPAPGAVLALSGFVPEVPGWEPSAGGREQTRWLIHHGAADPVIGIEFAHRSRERLQALGIEPEYLESDAGHWIPPQLLPRLRQFVDEA